MSEDWGWNHELPDGLPIIGIGWYAFCPRPLYGQLATDTGEFKDDY